MHCTAAISNASSINTASCLRQSSHHVATINRIITTLTSTESHCTIICSANSMFMPTGRSPTASPSLPDLSHTPCCADIAPVILPSSEKLFMRVRSYCVKFTHYVTVLRGTTHFFACEPNISHIASHPVTFSDHSLTKTKQPQQSQPNAMAHRKQAPMSHSTSQQSNSTMRSIKVRCRTPVAQPDKPASAATQRTP